MRGARPYRPHRSGSVPPRSSILRGYCGHKSTVRRFVAESQAASELCFAASQGNHPNRPEIQPARHLDRSRISGPIGVPAPTREPAHTREQSCPAPLMRRSRSREPLGRSSPGAGREPRQSREAVEPAHLPGRPTRTGTAYGARVALPRKPEVAASTSRKTGAVSPIALRERD